MAAVQACASSSVQTCLWFCHGQGTELCSSTKQPVSQNTLRKSGTHSLVYWYNALLNIKRSRRNSANQEKFHTSLSILTTPGKSLTKEENNFIWPTNNVNLQKRCSNNGRERSFHNVCWAHCRNKMKRYRLSVQGWCKSGWRHKPQQFQPVFHMSLFWTKVYSQQFSTVCGKTTPNVSNITNCSNLVYAHYSSISEAPSTSAGA